VRVGAVGIVQVSIRLENVPGQLSLVSELLGENDLNVIGLNVATAFGDGLLRFVADDSRKAAEVLKSQGYEVETEEILACQTPHHAGGLGAILKPLKEADINVNYLYPCIGTASNGQTVLLLGVSDLASARQALRRNWIIMAELDDLPK